MRLFSILVVMLILNACSSGEQTEKTVSKRAPERGELSEDSKVFLGNRLFSEKTCITCHSVDSKKIGPSVNEIVRIYVEQDADIEAFLKGNSNPIVDTTQSQIAIMQANIDGFLKKVTDEELNAIATYMLHVAK
jgi:cytochrome c